MSNRKTVDQCGVMLYQSKQGDKAFITSTFNYDILIIKINHEVVNILQHQCFLFLIYNQL